MEQGFVVWFTGVAASGKSTVAREVENRLRARGLKVENLDADEVRKNLSPDLGYSLEARDINTKRLAYMGQLLSRNGVAVLIAAVSSLRSYRDRARSWISNFVEVWTKCPQEVCRQRDPKGLYLRADRGEINDIAGVHQPYEEPLAAEVVLETDRQSPQQCADQVIAKLEELGCLAPEPEQQQVYSPEEEEKIKARLRALGYL